MMAGLVFLGLFPQGVIHLLDAVVRQLPAALREVR
jgi:hypothetical protein